jgi:hypothetical protein
MLFLVGCGASQTDEVVEDGILQLTFDGESCTYEGPTTLKAGPVTLLFLNESEEVAQVSLMRHTGDETIQDMIDYFGEEPLSPPPWVVHIRDAEKVVNAAESHTWEGVLEPGIHTMLCFGGTPYGEWIGGGFTVEE